MHHQQKQNLLKALVQQIETIKKIKQVVKSDTQLVKMLNDAQFSLIAAKGKLERE